MEKYGPEKLSYMDTFETVIILTGLKCKTPDISDISSACTRKLKKNLTLTKECVGVFFIMILDYK